MYDIQNIKKETRYPSWTKSSDGQEPTASEVDYNTDDEEEWVCVEEDIKYIDTLIEKQGWKYSGVSNMYIPMERDTREETVSGVLEAIVSDKRLRKYSPKVISGTQTNSCTLKKIDIRHMTEPSAVKYDRYEKYYLENSGSAHGIIVDENRKIRDGYIAYLLSEKCGCKVDIMEVPKESPIAK